VTKKVVVHIIIKVVARKAPAKKVVMHVAIKALAGKAIP
jgi:hypothetical protein